MKNFIMKFIGKALGKQVDGQTVLSKAKLTAIVYVIVVAAQELSKAWGTPVEIPPEVFRVLEAAGLWSLRSALPDAKK